MSQLPQPALPEIAGAAGLDFFVIDMEHAAIAGQDVAHMTRAAQAAGTTAIVRVRWAEEKTLLWILDSGVEGLMIPLVENAAAARRVYDLSHFPPDGERTICPQSRAAAHGAVRSNVPQYVEAANRELLLSVLLETPESAALAGTIAREPIDVVIIGRGDLALQMGHPGEPGHPDVEEVTKRALSAAIEAGKTAGIMAYGIEEAEAWIAFGCQFVIYTEPELILVGEYSAAVTELRELKLDGRN